MTAQPSGTHLVGPVNELETDCIFLINVSYFLVLGFGHFDLLASLGSGIINKSMRKSRKI